MATQHFYTTPRAHSSQNWFVKYKLYHIPFWALYHYLWWTLHGDSAIEAANNLLNLPYTIKYLSYVLFQAIGVYFCLYYLIPKFLEKGRYLVFLLVLALTVLCVSGLITTGYYFSAYVTSIDFEQLFKMPPNNPYAIFKFNALPSSIASMTLGMSIKLAKNWIEAKEQRQLLEKEKLETELKFLRSQFNPHFLFNTINSIFVLIDKNTSMASESLAKFSSLLRYQLYECNESQIPLHRELAYLESFIELEELRQNENFELDVQLPTQGTGDLMIAPFVLMPFIENAFKHVSKTKGEVNWINIKLELVENRLNFEVSNRHDEKVEKAREVVDYSGLGLKNVQRRLSLLYPDKHNLRIRNEDDSFSIQLKIELQKSVSPTLAAV